ncbi:MAG: RNB domain-containing ribonuclease [Nitrospirae bacterium]|nr:RNB domain-containing ribonuclease [Nitrospirota bacterium]
MEHTDRQHRLILKRIAHRVMLEKGLLSDFSKEAEEELAAITTPATADNEQVRDLRDLLWCSIDNDDSRDLDQLTVAEKMPDEGTKLLIAVADVDAIVRSGSAIDAHAKHNTTSVYTDAEIFPMLPEKLSTDLSSLNFQEDRLAIVVEIIISGNGTLRASDIYRAIVRNKAKLAYNSVAAWLEGDGPLPEAAAEVGGLAEDLQLQDKAAQKMKAHRHEHGALDFETIQTRALFDNDEVRDLEERRRNRAMDIIEDFMVAANGVTARYLASKNFPSLRRVVRIPKRWERIVEVAAEHDYTLSARPDSKALEQFLVKAKADDPLRFPDLSLTIIKLMGAGEYVAEFPGQTAPGHFGLAVKDYSHSTAPNRRYPDLITHRLLKAALSGGTVPYQQEELEELAQHCTEQEDAANKVERQVGKSAAALLLKSRIGEEFDALVTGAADKGTWVRIFHPPVEGKLMEGFKGVDVGDKIRVQLLRTDVDRGFIDFRKVSSGRQRNR